VSSTPKYEEYENHVPELQVPGWFEGTNVYLESKITGNVESYTTWTLLLAANLLEKNTNGLNGLFSDVIESGFGATFENLCARAGQLKDSDSAKLDGRIIEKLGLDEILEGDVIISKAELDVLLAGLRIIKASLEWLASYNWETDFSFLKYDWNNYDEFQNKLRTATDAQLPFKNNFLKNQDETLLNKSKADYLSAIDTLVGAYDAIGDKDYIPEAVKDEWNNYLWIKDGLGKLRAAINGGGAFYVPENMPSGNVWPNQKSGAVWGIDMGKFFEKNYLTLDKLVENGSGKPKFYTITGDPPLGTPLNSSPNSGDRAVIGFKMLLTPVKNLIPVGLGDLEESLYLPMPPEVGKILYDLYNN
jgi:hypothetical protein